MAILTANRIFSKKQGVFAAEKWYLSVPPRELLRRAILYAVGKILTSLETVWKGGVLEIRKRGFAEH